MSLPDVLIATNRLKVVTIAQAMLDGSMRVVDGALALNSLRHRLGLDEFDNDFLPFLNFSDEMDHLPIGPEKQYWAADVLPSKEAEIARREAEFREEALEACRRLVGRFTLRDPLGNACDENTPNI